MALEPKQLRTLEPKSSNTCIRTTVQFGLMFLPTVASETTVFQTTVASCKPHLPLANQRLQKKLTKYTLQTVLLLEAPVVEVWGPEETADLGSQQTRARPTPFTTPIPSPPHPSLPSLPPP